ncbi:testis-expressed protein 36 isoform X2 [Trichomycterus rosablanca]
MQHGERTREACTSTGAMLAQSAPQHTLQGERYPKVFINPEQKNMGRSYTFSVHNNRATLQDDIDAYTNSLGRRKCLDDRRQHNSHFVLCHDDNMSAVEMRRMNHSAHQTDHTPKLNTESTSGTHSRRFPKNHKERSQQAAFDHTGECFMWFGRNNLDHNVQAASNNSSFL